MSPAFENAAEHARPECPKCHGTGSYMYDHNHGTVCNRCCQHNMGWWLLKEWYGCNNGKWCCVAGCGLVLDEHPELPLSPDRDNIRANDGPH